MFTKRIIYYGNHLQKSFISSNIAPATSQKRKPPKSIITITTSASSKITTMFSLLNQPYPLGIRISINKRGCNGLNYTMKYVDADDAGRKAVLKDDIITIADNVKIFIDPSAIFAIVGSVMDWKENEITSEFTFINPNAKGSCGCGESFNV
jgi:iron-sulfur cluster assembly protein